MYNVYLKNAQTGKRVMNAGIALCMCAVLANGAWDTKVSAHNEEDAVVEVISFDDAEESDIEVISFDEAEDNNASLSMPNIIESAMPSIVSVNTKPLSDVQEFYNQYGFSFYSNATEEMAEGSASGVIIDKNETELLVVTSYHTIMDSDTITITVSNGESFSADVKGYDSERDIAVVSIPLSDIDDVTLDTIEVATIGNTDELQVGEQILAIGTALGYGQSATTGMVSGKNQKIDKAVCTCDNTMNLIQTNISVNPINNGGPMINMNGEVVGINSNAIISSVMDGMGYAISIADVTEIVSTLTTEADTIEVSGEEQGNLGINGIAVSDELNVLYGIPVGVYVTSVAEGSAAEQAGIKENYIITAFDGEEISSMEQLDEILFSCSAGEQFDVEVMYLETGDFVTELLTVTIGESLENHATFFYDSVVNQG